VNFLSAIKLCPDSVQGSNYLQIMRKLYLNSLSFPLHLQLP